MVCTKKNGTIKKYILNTKKNGTTKRYMLSTKEHSNLQQFNTRSNIKFSFVRDIFFNNGLFIIVTYYSKIYTSTDGVNWTLRYDGTKAGMRRVVYGNNMYVVACDYTIGGYGIVISYDGINWTEVSTDIRVECIAYGNGRFVGTYSNMAYVSEDGVNWTYYSLPFSVVDISYGNSKFVIFGPASFSSSEDGITWTTAVSIPDASTSVFGGIVAANGKYVVGDYNGKIFVSEDGVNWTTVPTGTSSYISRMYFLNNKYSALQNGSILTSDDAYTWTRNTTSLSTVGALGYGNSIYVINVSENGSGYAYTDTIIKKYI